MPGNGGGSTSCLLRQSEAAERALLLSSWLVPNSQRLSRRRARLRTLTDARLDDSADQLCPLNTTYCHFPQHWVDPYVEFRQCIEWETTVLLNTAHNLRDSCWFLESRSTCRNTVTGVGGFETFPSPIGGQTVTNLFPRLLDDESKNDAVQRKHIN